MKLLNKLKEFGKLLNKEENYAMFLSMIVINTILLDGGSIFSTIPWIMLTTFLFKLKYKSSRMITWHTLGSLLLLGISSNKLEYTAMLIISETICLFAGFALYSLTKTLLNKDIKWQKKVLKGICSFAIIAFALLINMFQYGSTLDYFRASKILKNYFEETYPEGYNKANVYYDYSNNNPNYYINVLNVDNFEKFRISTDKIGNIYDGQKIEYREEKRQDLISSIIVAINNNENLSNLTKEDIQLLFNNFESTLDDLYKNEINIEIDLKDRFENSTEFNNYLLVLFNELRDLGLNYNKVTVKSNIENQDSYYEALIMNGQFPKNLAEVEEKSSIISTKE